MIKSMTAYACAEKTNELLTVSIEIRSVNSRHLDAVVRAGHGYALLEEKIKAALAEKISRGRVEIKVVIKDERQEANAFEIDTVKAKAYHDALVRLKTEFNLAGDISVDLMAGVNGLVRPVDAGKDTDACWPMVRDCLYRALDGLDAMRGKEGDYLAEDFTRRLEFIENRIMQIEARSHGLLEIYKKRLEERIISLTGKGIEIDSGRIEQEAALLADRSEISEELVRAQSHVRQFYEIMKAEEPGGRKLNFLLQEFNREFNTMGSKTGNTDISHMIVEVKAELEKLREQVQNVE
ncbi:MAG: YicC family protein [Desulfobacteraceae bacterium 4572_123]|nr:MAG: YicC family protein [Desulfobacteraceae bacterium 4572_123]